MLIGERFRMEKHCGCQPIARRFILICPGPSVLCRDPGIFQDGIRQSITNLDEHNPLTESNKSNVKYAKKT